MKVNTGQCHAQVLSPNYDPVAVVATLYRYSSSMNLTDKSGQIRQKKDKNGKMRTNATEKG